MKINFKIDIEKDFDNYYEAVNAKEHYGENSTFWARGIPENVRDLIKNRTKEEAYKNTSSFFQKSYRKYEKYFKIFIKQVEEYWGIIEKEFFKRLETITKKKFPSDEVVACLTTIQKCPYNYEEKWFMISFLNHPLFCTEIMAHELMHFHFLYYNLENIKEQIGESKANDLKEALTVLLNLEFRDLFFFEDKGYKGHKKLREFITEEWKKGKNYDKLLDKCVEFLKANGD